MEKTIPKNIENYTFIFPDKLSSRLPTEKEKEIIACFIKKYNKKNKMQEKFYQYTDYINKKYDIFRIHLDFFPAFTYNNIIRTGTIGLVAAGSCPDGNQSELFGL